jgi:hypothetical protein
VAAGSGSHDGDAGNQWAAGNIGTFIRRVNRRMSGRKKTAYRCHFAMAGYLRAAMIGSFLPQGRPIDRSRCRIGACQCAEPLKK